ncbi:MAG TPA: hypothetical protein VEI97_04965, partial [bacterium]|nr:hypothetical protein [bacterium]
MAALAAALLALATLAPLPSGYAQEGRPRGIPRPTDWSTFAAQLGLPEEGGQRPQLKLVEGDFPHLAIGSHPLHLIGWDLGGNLQVPQRDLIKQIETAEGVELPVVVIRVDLASISEAQNKRNLNKVKELANAAQNLQRWFILALELDWAPDWYLRSGVRTVQETNPSNLRQDREMDLVGPVPPGPVRQPGRGGQVAMAD